jgi:hypothetical protein
MATREHHTKSSESAGTSDHNPEYDRKGLESKHKEEDDWTLNTDQMIFMLQNHIAIELAFSNNDVEFLRNLEGTKEFQAFFGDLSFDEAYDRYECMLEDIEESE